MIKILALGTLVVYKEYPNAVFEIIGIRKHWRYKIQYKTSLHTKWFTETELLKKIHSL